MNREELKGKGPYTIVNGEATDAGLFDHVFDGTDDALDELIKVKKVRDALKKEVAKRGLDKPLQATPELDSMVESLNSFK